jgi:hypothetical protein
MFRTAVLCVAALWASSIALADFQYQQTTKITGGAMLSMVKMMSRFSGQMRQALEPMTQSVFLKGNRMAHVGKDATEIIDLDAETITHIDNVKKTYSVMTFAEMKKAMEDAGKEMEQKMNQKQSPEMSDAEMSFKANVRDGNKTKEVSGMNTNLKILTLSMDVKDKKSGEAGAMAVTSDMWMAPEVPGYKEVRDFQMRMAQKMGIAVGGTMGPMAAAMQKSMMRGFSELAKESSKLNGVPVLMVTRMGATAEGQPLPSAAEAPLPPTPEMHMPSVGDAVAEGAARSATNEAASQLGRAGSLGRIAAGGIGGFGGFGKKKQQQPAPQQTPPPTTAQEQAAASVLMEMESEMSGFSSAPVNAASLAIPAGFKQVESEMMKRAK